MSNNYIDIDTFAFGHCSRWNHKKTWRKKRESEKTMFADVWMRERSRAETATVCPVSTISSVNSRPAADNISLYLGGNTTTACRLYPLSIADLLFTQYLGIWLHFIRICFVFKTHFFLDFKHSGPGVEVMSNARPPPAPPPSAHIGHHHKIIISRHHIIIMILVIDIISVLNLNHCRLSWARCQAGRTPPSSWELQSYDSDSRWSNLITLPKMPIDLKFVFRQLTDN